MSLRRGGRALVTVNRSLRAGGLPRGNRTRLVDRRADLRRDVNAGVVTARTAVRRALVSGGALDATTASRVVETALDPWSGTGRRALAVTNGSFERRVVALAARRAALDDGRRARLDARVRAAVDAAVRSRRSRVREGRVDDLSADLRDAARLALRDELERRGAVATADLVETATERHLGRAVTAVPAGLPVAPYPGFWYATVNAWVVEVRGTFPAFGVRLAGDGTTPGLRYVRDGSVARVDVDADGRRERLGRGERVRFRSNTTVVVAVPPGKTGVGDVDGLANETSPGWPRSGCVAVNASCVTGA